MRNGLGFVLCVGALALAAGACGVEYSSLGQRPEEGTGGGGGAGGSPMGPQCAGPNPAGCGEDAPCPQGSTCVELDSTVCAPSSCQCGVSGEWGCTKDCVAPRSCMPAPGGAPALAARSRAFFACGPVDEPIFGRQIGLVELSCSPELPHPSLVLFPGGSLGEGPGGEAIYGLLPPEAGVRSVYLKGPGPDDRIEVESGSIVIRAWGVLAGEYDVVLVDGQRLKGDFRDEIDCQNLAGPCG